MKKAGMRCKKTIFYHCLGTNLGKYVWIIEENSQTLYIFSLCQSFLKTYDVQGLFWELKSYVLYRLPSWCKRESEMSVNYNYIEYFPPSSAFSITLSSVLSHQTPSIVSNNKGTFN